MPIYQKIDWSHSQTYCVFQVLINKIWRTLAFLEYFLNYIHGHIIVLPNKHKKQILMFLKSHTALFQMHVSGCVCKNVWKEGGVRFLASHFPMQQFFITYHSRTNKVKMYECNQITRYPCLWQSTFVSLDKIFISPVLISFNFHVKTS